MYHSVVNVFKNCELEYFKTKLQSSIFLYASTKFTKGSDMLNKNSLGVKRYKANKKKPYLCATKIFRPRIVTLAIKDVLNYLNDI